MLKIKDIKKNKTNNIFIARALISEMNKLVRNKKDNFIYEYNGKFYELLEKQDFKDRLFIFLEKYSITERWTTSTMNSIISAIHSCPSIKKVKLDDYDDLIAIKNGLFNIITQEIIPYSDDIYITSIIESLEYKKPEKWDLSSIIKFAPNFQEYLFSTFNSDINTIENIAMMFGCLISTSTKANKFFILSGESGAGKSPLLKLIDSFFTEEQKTSLSLKQISTKSGFERESILTSRINIIGDEEKTFLASGELKRITSQENITVQRKGEKSVNFKPKFKIIVATNHPPKFDDDSDGIANRLLIVKFKNIFESQNKLNEIKNPEAKNCYLEKKNIEEDILKKEMSAVLNFSIWGLKKFNEENKAKNKGKYEFIYDKNFKEAIEEYKKNANTFYEFLVENYEYKEDLPLDNWINILDIKAHHNSWHSENVQDRFPPKISKTKIGKNIKTIFKCEPKRLNRDSIDKNGFQTNQQVSCYQLVRKK